MRDAMDRPNVILVNCDDLGYGDVGCYGSSVNRTPALDRMAGEGVRFTNFYMASSVCSPSRGAMMTGCHPRRIGFSSFDGKWVLFPGQGLGLSPSEITIASLLRRQGYATSLVGKWHCGDQPEFLPTRHGFDRYYGLPYSNDMGRQAGAVVYPPLPLLKDEQVIQEQPDQTALTERYIEQCVSFMRENRDRPFFLYLAHMHVHLPLYVQRRFEKASLNGRYGAAVECIDWSMAVLMDELERLGLAANTIVMFTSDNGSRCRGEGGSNAPLRGTKGTCWEGGLRVPLIVRWSGVIGPGAACHELATSMDFLPTLAGLAGAQPPADRIIDGKDIRPLLLDPAGARSPHEAFFYYMMDSLWAVRSGRWKLHVYRDKAAVQELYDLESDAGETVNVVDKHPDVVRRLTALAQACRDDLGDAVVGAPGRNCRPVGRVPNPVPLTRYDPNHPYLEAMYDLKEKG